MSTPTLHMSPAACSQVAAIVLEEAKVPFDIRVVRFKAGEQKSPAYKQINPKGKVPALEIDGVVLTENVAIILYLNERFPEANLLPAASTAAIRSQQISDLCFCASTLHPLVSRIRMPHAVAGLELARPVWERAVCAMREFFQLIDDCLADQTWWYGDVWSAMDPYLHWMFWRVEGAGFPVTDFPNYGAHALRVRLRPATVSALARETAAEAALRTEDMLVVFPPLPS